MNNFNSNQDRFNDGFATRLQQLVIKEASLKIIEGDEELSKQASVFSAAFRRVAPHLGQAAERVPFSSRLAGSVGSGVGKLMSMPARAVQSVINPNRQAGMISHAVGGLGEGFLSGFGPRGRAMGKSFRDLATRPVRFGGGATSGAGQTMADALQARNPITGASPEFTRAFQGSHTSAIPRMQGTPSAGMSVGGGPEAAAYDELFRRQNMVSPGTGVGAATPDWVPGQGAGATGAGGAGGAGGVPPGAGAGAAAGAAGAGDPTGGLLNKMRGYIPARYQDWMNQHPQLTSGLVGAGIGGGTVYGADQYGDYKRRQALANANIMERLALAFQLATNPQGFSNTLRL